MRPRPKICIIAHYASGAMLGGHNGHVGGVERQTTLTARWLAAQGYETSLLVYNEAQAPDVVVDGVRVISMCKVSQGLPGVRFFHPRTTSLFAAMKKANADVYYHNCAEYFTGWAAFWCAMNNRKFVYSTAHDFDCNVRLPALNKWYERILYRYGIRHADALIVQTEFQRRLLKQSFDLDSIALPMPCPGPEPHDYVQRTFPAQPKLVWVGRVVPEKRLEWFLDIAEQIPNLTFEVAAANIGSNPYATALFDRAQSLKNVKWLGSVPREQMPAVYQSALCLCSTSVHEGFPNTFLEAWSHGTPIVTTFDPDGLVATRGMGHVVSDVASSVAAIRGLVSKPADWERLSRNARHYYEAHHMVDIAIARFEKEFLNVWHNYAPQERGKAGCPSLVTD